MVTLSITSADIGAILGYDGTLREIRYMAAPSKGTYGFVTGSFCLSETGDGAPRAVWNCDMTSAMFTPATPDTTCNSVLFHGSVAFSKLTVTRVPA
jgi:hypothetical protein